MYALDNVIFYFFLVFDSPLSAAAVLKERQDLDRRRLEHAHLQYALLQMIRFFSSSLCLKDISFKDFNATLLKLAPALHQAFTGYYAGMVMAEPISIIY